MADDHGIVCLRRQGPVGLVCHGNIFQGNAGFKLEGGDDGDPLLGNEVYEGILGLVFGCDSSCSIGGQFDTISSSLLGPITGRLTIFRPVLIRLMSDAIGVRSRHFTSV